MIFQCLNGTVLIDAADLPLVEGQKWSLFRGYARSGSARRGEGRAMHRVIMGAGAGEVVDHVNGDPSDNRRANLRFCTAQENARNRRPHSGREFKGVTPRMGRYRACILVNGKQVSLGGYETAIEAALAYDRAAASHHGEFARLNFDPARDWLFPYPPVDVEARIIRRGR